MAVADRINGAARRVPAWTIYIVTALWAGWEFFQAATQQAEYLVEPINVLERTYGEAALILLVAGLCVTPLRKFAGVNLLKFRRAIGVSAFFLVLAHFLVWAVLDVQSVSRIWADIVKRPYVTVGMAAFLMLIPLALTSNNWAVRKLGALRWRSLHKLTYPAAVLGGVHYLWLVKGFQIEPILYLAGIVGLLALRVSWQKRRTQVAAPSR